MKIKAHKCAWAHCQSEHSVSVVRRDFIPMASKGFYMKIKAHKCARAHCVSKHSVSMRIVSEVSSLTLIDSEPEAKGLPSRRLCRDLIPMAYKGF